MKKQFSQGKTSDLLVGNFNLPTSMSEHISSRRQKLSTLLVGRLKDRDKDLTPDWVDCAPDDPTKHGLLSSIKSAVSSASSAVKSAVSSIVSKVSGGSSSSSRNTGGSSSSSGSSRGTSSGGVSFGSYSGNTFSSSGGSSSSSRNTGGSSSSSGSSTTKGGVYDYNTKTYTDPQGNKYSMKEPPAGTIIIGTPKIGSSSVGGSSGGGSTKGGGSLSGTIPNQLTGTISPTPSQSGFDAIKQTAQNLGYNFKQFITGKYQYIQNPFAPLKSKELTSYTIPESKIPVYRHETLMTDPFGKNYSPQYILIPETKGNSVEDVKTTFKEIPQVMSATISGLDKVGETLISKTPEPVQKVSGVIATPVKFLLTSARTGFDVVTGITHAQDKPSYTDMFDISTSRDVPIWKRIGARAVIGYEARDIEKRTKNVTPLIREYNKAVSKLNEATSKVNEVTEEYKSGKIDEKEYENFVKNYEMLFEDYKRAEKKLEENEDYKYIQSRGGISEPFSTIVAQSNLSEGGKFFYAFGNTATKFIPTMIPVTIGQTATEGLIGLSEGKIGTAAASGAQLYLLGKVGGKGGGKISSLGVGGLIGVGEGVEAYKETGSLSYALGSGTGAVAGIYGGKVIKDLGRITIERKEIPNPRRNLKATETISMGNEKGSIYPTQKLGQIGREGSRAVTSSVWRDIVRKSAQKVGIKVSDDFLRIYKGNPYAQPNVYKSELARLKRTYGISDWEARKILRLDAPRTIDYGIELGAVKINGKKSVGAFEFYQEPKRIDTGVQGIKTRGGKGTTDFFTFQRASVGRGAITEGARTTFEKGGKTITLKKFNEFVLSKQGEPFIFGGKEVVPSKGISAFYDGQKRVSLLRNLEVRVEADANKQSDITIFKKGGTNRKGGVDKQVGGTSLMTKQEILKQTPSFETPSPSPTKQTGKIIPRASLTIFPTLDLKLTPKLSELEKQEKKQRTSFFIDTITKTSQDTSLKQEVNPFIDTTTKTNQGTSFKQEQIITPIITPPETIERELPSPNQPKPELPEIEKPIIGGFWFPDEKKKKKEDTPYDAYVLRETTNRRKARWQQVADNVPLITALSLGARDTDQTPSNQFKVVRGKGKVNQVVDKVWNSLRNKFRDYTSKSGIRVGLRPGRYIEGRMFRIDSSGEVAAIPQRGQEVLNQRKFGRLRKL